MCTCISVSYEKMLVVSRHNHGRTGPLSLTLSTVVWIRRIGLSRHALSLSPIWQKFRYNIMFVSCDHNGQGETSCVIPCYGHEFDFVPRLRLQACSSGDILCPLKSFFNNLRIFQKKYDLILHWRQHADGVLLMYEICTIGNNHGTTIISLNCFCN